MGNLNDSNLQERDKNVTFEEMTTISRMIRRDQHRPLARELQLTEQSIQEIDAMCLLNNLEFEDNVIQILLQWKFINAFAATKGILKDALVTIGRRDIADVLYSNVKEDPQKLKMQYKGTQELIEETQRKRCKKIQLPQVIWTEITLPLEELYVNLKLFTSTEGFCSKEEPIQPEELFNKIDGKDPVRIVIEGRPGYGKTTLCLKLLNDWGQFRNYVSDKFKMVFLLELRYITGNLSLDEILKRECEAIGVNGDDGINCIEAFENETLLILDGFDELNEECKRVFIPLFQKEIYPSLFVVVTTRRGMLQVKKNNEHLGGYCEKNVMEEWNRKVIVNGVMPDKLQPFMEKYLKNDYQELIIKMKSFTEGDMKEVFECPLCLILLAMLLEENTLENLYSKTTLYKEFIHFIIRRNLFREKKMSTEEEVDILNPWSQFNVFQSLNEFGRLAVDHLCENKLIFEEKELLSDSNYKSILELGFLTKIPQMEEGKRKHFYQPIHKTFLEFLAAFAMWNLFKTDENRFKQEIERIGNTGLKPTNDSLFYVFLGGFMNDKAYVLFQCLTRYSLWFNIESLCFVNILLEIKDINSFFPAFQPILDPFIPSLYSINGLPRLMREYFQSEIHSLILKHASDRQLIHSILWNSTYSVNLTHELKIKYLNLYLTREVFNFSSNKNKYSIKCQNIICHFTKFFPTDKWKEFVSLFNLIQSEKVHFFFDALSFQMNSIMFHLFHKELVEGQWKKMNIDRLNFHLKDMDDPYSVKLLVDLVKKNRINEGVQLSISWSCMRTPEAEILLKTESRKLFNAVTNSENIMEFYFFNEDCNFSPEFYFNHITNLHMKSFRFAGSLLLLNSNKKKKEKLFVEEIGISSYDDEKNINLVQNIHGIKYLSCSLPSFNSLTKMNWPDLNKLEELELYKIGPESYHLLNFASQLSNLQVLSLNMNFIEIIPVDFKSTFINFFSSFNLRICEFLLIQNLESLSFSTEVLLEGLKKKFNESSSSSDTHEGQKVPLQELVVSFHKIKIDFNELKECSGIRLIQSMLRNHQLVQFYWDNRFDIVKSHQFELLFSLNDNFRIVNVQKGMDRHSSRRSQYEYDWFDFHDCFCINFIE